MYTGKDNLIENAIDHIANGIFNLFKSIGKVPLVRVINNEISEKIFKKLSQLYSQSKDEASPNKSERPLLIILDRNFDLHTMLYHSWSYLSLI